MTSWTGCANLLGRTLVAECQISDACGSQLGADGYARLIISRPRPIFIMLLSKEYVGYLAREVTKKLIAGEFIETKNVPALAEKIHSSMLDEFTLEDRINDEVRVILEAYSDEMRKSGANYQEMFRKVKNELVRKYKAVL